MVDATLANDGTIVVRLDGGIPEDEVKGLTSVRMLIKLWVVAAVANQGGLISMGIYLIEGDAQAAGAIAEPQDTGDDAAWAWRLARQQWAQGASLRERSNYLNINEDIHSMRKYPGEDYTLGLAMVNHEADGTCNIDGMVRTLFKRA